MKSLHLLSLQYLFFVQSCQIIFTLILYDVALRLVMSVTRADIVKEIIDLEQILMFHLDDYVQ